MLRLPGGALAIELRLGGSQIRIGGGEEDRLRGSFRAAQLRIRREIVFPALFSPGLCPSLQVDPGQLVE
jgi:hypothetical protein